MTIEGWMEEKIIQIIPAPSGMFAKWEPDNDNEEFEFSRIVCLALVDGGEGLGQSVHPMVAFDDGTIEDVLEFSNFGGIVFRGDEATLL